MLLLGPFTKRLRENACQLRLVSPPSACLVIRTQRCGSFDILWWRL